jgi:hypothetical protein
VPMRRAFALALIPVLTACSTGSSQPKAPSTITVTGTLTLSRGTDLNWVTLTDVHEGATCYGTSGYGDIAKGAQVTVYDAHGTVIGSGALGDGTVQSTDCVFAFSVPAVSKTNFYQVEVSHRGKITVTPAEVGSVSLTLG